MAINSISFTRTPQAGDDTYGWTEDQLLISQLLNGQVIVLDVMANDLGGAAKALYSIDDGNGNTLASDFELLVKDVVNGASAWELTGQGNWMRINNGKIEFKLDGSLASLGALTVNSLAATDRIHDEFVYAIRLANGTLSQARVSINIEGSNDGPVISSGAGAAAGAVQEDAVLVATGQLSASDADHNATQRWSIAGSATGAYGSLAVDAATGRWIYTLANGSAAVQALAAGESHVESFVVRVTDDQGAYAEQTVRVSVTGTNDAPVAVDDAGSLYSNEAKRFDVLANDTDVDSGDTKTLVAAGVGAGQGSVSIVDGQVRFEPGQDFAGLRQDQTVDVVVSYTVQDGAGAQSTGHLVVTVIGISANTPPVAADSSESVDEDGSLTASFNASDAEDATLQYAITTAPQHGTVAINADGSYTYTPEANYNGADGFGYSATDSAGETASASVIISVAAVNDAPTTTGASLSTDEDAAVTGLVSGADVDGDSLTFSLAGGVAHGSLLFNDDGSFTYTPEADYNGADGFSYTVSDGHGGSATAAVNITVNAVNDAPVTAGGSAATDEDTPLLGQLAAQDVDHDTLTYSLDIGTGHGALALNADGSYSYTPAADFNGTDSFSYTVSDGHGGSAAGSVSITVNAVNDAPTTAGASVATDEDTALTGQLTSEDVDHDTLSYTLAVDGDAVNGTLLLASDGSYSYTPAADFNGTDSFSYVVSDGHGGSAAGSVSITVNAVNDAPTTADSSATTDEDTVLGGQLLAADVDHDILTYTLADDGDVTNGTLSLNGDGSYSYTPAADFNGTDSFSYVVSDGHGGSATGSVSITVNPVNDAPTTAGASVVTDEDSALTGQLAAADVDHDTLSYTLAVDGDAVNGTLLLASDGSYSYTPAADFNGTDSFRYVVSDGHGGSATGSVSITVNPVNDAPVAVTVSAATSEDTLLAGQLVATDADGDTLHFTLGSGASHGTLQLGGNGQFTYTPAADYNGADSFSYTVDDGHGGSASASVAITIAAVNDAPVTASTAVSVNEDTPLNGQLAASDVDFDLLTFALAGAGTIHGQVQVNANGSYSYTPTANYFGSDSFSYTVNDGHGGSATASVAITVNPVNDAPVLSTAVTAQSGFVNQSFTLALAGNFSDADGDALGYQAALESGAPLPAWLGFNAATGSFSGTPGNSDVGLYSVRVTATDPAGATASTVFALSVLDGTVINGTNGNDTLNGTINGDRINGLDGNDTINGNTGADFIDGGNGNDTLNGDAGDDVLLGQAGDDTFNGGNGSDSIFGGAGNDTVIIASTNTGVDTLDLGPGADRVTLSLVNTLTVNGIAGGAFIDMGSDSDVDIVSIAGWRTLNGFSAVISHFTAGTGGDILSIDLGAFLTNGWDGVTNLFSASTGFLRLQQSGADTLVQADVNGVTGGAQFFSIATLQGVAMGSLVAGNFAPLYNLDGSLTPGVTITGDANANTYNTVTFPPTTGGDDTINGLGGNDNINGGPGNDQLFGGDGNDTLDGGTGNDTVFGGNGGDVLVQTFGVDSLFGEAGADRFVLNLVASLNGVGNFSDLGVDTSSDLVQLNVWSPATSSTMAVISNFTPGPNADRIDLVNFPGTFAGWDGNTNPFSTGTGGGYLRVLQSGADTLLQMDASGPSNGVDFQTFFKLVGVTATSLTSANFTLGFNPDGGVTQGVTITGTAAADGYSTSTTPGTTGGDDIVFGLGGNDNILGGPGDDQLSGGDGNDILNGEAGSDTLHGDAGDDSLTGGDGDDTIFGDDGNDTINGSAGNNTIFGGNGNDTVVDNNSAGVDTVDLGPGADRFTVSLQASLNGTGPNVNMGIDSDIDTLALSSWGVNSANQAVVTNFTPGAGGDVFDFSTILAVFTAWDGVSNLFGSGYMRAVQVGADTQVQADTNAATGGLVYVTMATLRGVNVDSLTGANFNPGFNPTGGGVNGQTFNGTNGNDTLTGTVGDDNLFGVGGNDVLNGGNGNDNLVGGDGNDTLDGGFGRDLYTGGLGSDTFKFSLGAARETVTDFQQGVGGDKLDIKALLSGYTAANAANFIRFDASGADTLLMVDSDGAANGANFQQIATLQLVGITSLTDMLANGNLVPV